MRWHRIVDPAFEMDLPQEDDSKARLGANPWLQPWAVSRELELRLATSCTVVHTDEGLVLIDPFCTFGDTADFERRMQLLTHAGVGRDEVIAVVLSHVDGIGVCFDGDGAPAFPRARFLVPGDDLRGIDSGAYPELEPLLAFAEPHHGSGVVAPDVSLVELPGHQAGHSGIAIGDPWQVLATGHLFIHPSQVAAIDEPGLDEDVATAADTRRRILGRAADEGFALLGPLWPSPGVATVTRKGDGFALVPLTG